MAIVNKLVRESKSVTKQTDVNCTYDIFKIDGENWLQLDTFGSKKRKMLGKKSQSIRFSPEALKNLKEILEKYKI